MLKSILRATALLALRLFRSPPPQRTMTLSRREPSAQVADVVTGGSWSAEKQGGFYRTIVIMTGNRKGLRRAGLLAMACSSSEANPVPTVVATVPIKEINDQKLANADRVKVRRARTMRSPSS